MSDFLRNCYQHCYEYLMNTQGEYVHVKYNVEQMYASSNTRRYYCTGSKLFRSLWIRTSMAHAWGRGGWISSAWYILERLLWFQVPEIRTALKALLLPDAGKIFKLNKRKKHTVTPAMRRAQWVDNDVRAA